MKSRKRVLIGDMIFWVGLSLLATFLSAIAPITPQEWDAVKLGLTIGVPAGFWTMTITIYIKYRTTSPDYVIKLFPENLATGMTDTVEIGVWWGDVVAPVVPVETVVQQVVKFFPELGEVDQKSVLTAFDQATVEFRDSPIKIWGKWSFEKEKAGLQKGKAIIVHWPQDAGITETAFAHELLHLVDELCRKRYDLEHEDSAWWEAERVINDRVRDVLGHE